ncbi:unnamed protein product [Closterium sp. Yama58-4]|nr:unnamed protein product [Closterium sp. Yama58-4]
MAAGSRALFLGVDGGASSTSAVLLDLSRANVAAPAEAEGMAEAMAEAGGPAELTAAGARDCVVGRGSGGSSNKNSVGEASARSALQAAMEGALGAAGVAAGEVAGVCVGMAGVDRPADMQLVRSWLSPMFPHLPPSRLLIRNDALVAFASATLGVIPAAAATTATGTLPDESQESRRRGRGDSRRGRGGGGGSGGGGAVEGSVDGSSGGVVVISGTGTIAYGIAADGREARASGGGPLLGDKGSGYAMSCEALAAVLRAWDGRGRVTALTEAVLGHAGLSSPSELISWAYSDPAWARIAALFPCVRACAAAGDAAAMAVITDGVEEMALSAHAVACRLGFPESRQPFLIVTAGGVLTDSAPPNIPRMFDHQIRMLLPSAVVKPPQVEAALGAALLAWRATLC